ncbi:sulfite exporter TauE/SafE family protein [Lacisediminimonas profundi]|uniref:sulfite exporter TauE/SafE family protein n=1 Tax=Lacisediminimonas profundi TaxID=2603856 RepID=UPI00124B3D61|nr:TSUP family transporter [Lacisediminimonas profundi]
MTDFFLLGAAAFLAGLIDAVVGGGGLIQTPALFSVFGQTAPATLLGTSKLAGIWGTAAAAASYARRVKVRWATAAPAAAAAFLLAFLGAFTVTHVPPDIVRKMLPFVLVVVAIYTYVKKDFGQHHAPQHSGHKEKLLAVLVGGGIGFYDGFFGPGTGSFLVFMFVRFFGFDFLSASAAAKVVNVACNLAALLLFSWTGHILWQVGLLMAVCNIVGSVTGTRLAITRGLPFVRRLFLVVVSALVLKTAYDAFLR